MSDLPVKSSTVRAPVVLENEKTDGIEKIKNNSGAWGFFKYIYGKSAIKLLSLNMLMLLFAVPIYIIFIIYSNRMADALAALPYSNSFGIGIAPWGGMADYAANITSTLSMERSLWFALAIPLLAVPLSGGFAVIRDSYWTGKLKVIKPFLKGLKETVWQILPFTILVAAGFLGVNYAVSAVTGWVAVFLSVVLYIILGLFAVWTFVFAGVVTLYRQNFLQSVKSSLTLFVRFAVSNIVSFIIACILFALIAFNIYYIINAVALALVVLFGMVYGGLVWMIHMMNICRQAGADS